MFEYLFLFGLGFLWTIYSVVQDFKSGEVSNWLNFTLIAFALAYRAFYSLSSGESTFFFSGLIGFGFFFVLAHGFYYSRVFAGGDAKLLMGFGIILPYSNLIEMLYFGLIFILVFFFLGALYSLIYSTFIVWKNWYKFSEEFGKRFNWIFLVLIVVGAVLFSFDSIIGIVFVLVGLLYLLYFYVRALDVCMVREIKAGDLREGDWLEKDVRVGKKLIKKSVHGLSKEEIEILRKGKKKVLVKGGIPFTPAFLLALIFMVFFFLVLKDGAFSFLGF